MTVDVKSFNNTTLDAIEDLASIDYFPAIDKANIIAVLIENKPSMHTGFFSESTEIGNEPSSVYLQKQSTFENILTNLNLSYKKQIKRLERNVDGKPSYIEWVVYCIAKTLSTAVDLLNARENNDEKREGMLLGFPATAVDAYVNDTMLSMDEAPTSTESISDEAMKFLNHRLSKHNWEDEINYLPTFAENIKNISPKIYTQCLDES